MHETSKAKSMRAPAYVWWLAVCYSGFIIYCSIVDVGSTSVWTTPKEPYWNFLSRAWVPTITAFDIGANILAYVPIGLLFSWLTPNHSSTLQRIGVGACAGLTLSFGMETLQMWLPTRVPSPVDLGTNATGALLGAISASLWAPAEQPLTSVSSAYRRLFAPGRLSGICSLAFIIWVLLAGLPFVPRVDGAQIMLATQPLRDSIASPLHWHLAELMYVTFMVCGLGLLLQHVARDERSIAKPFALVVLLTVFWQPFIAGRVLTSEFAAGTLVGLTTFVLLSMMCTRENFSHSAGFVSLALACFMYRLAEPAVSQAQFFWSLWPVNALQTTKLLQLSGNTLITTLAIAGGTSTTQGSSSSKPLLQTIMCLTVFEYTLPYGFSRNGLVTPLIVACGGSLLARLVARKN